MELETPDSIRQLINHIQSQGDFITSISGAGIWLVLITWSRVRGMVSDINLKGFQWPNVLLAPLLFFFAAFVLGYVLTASLTGYFAEIVTSINSSSGSAISDARQHFNSDYFNILQRIGSIQLLSSFLGILVLSIWFIVNLLSLSDRRRKT